MDEMIQRYLKRCDHLIVPSESIKAKVEKEYHVEKPISVVPTPVDLSMFKVGEKVALRSSLGWTDDRVLLYVGRIAKEKKLDLLLNAFDLIAKEIARARLVLVGRGPYMEGLKEKTHDMGLGDRVVFAGAIPHEEVPRYMAAADLFVFTSTTDTQGLVLVEAMASGTPVVAVDAPGPTDVLQAGGGVLTEDSPSSFAEAVCALIESPPQLHELSEAASEVAKRYGIRAATRELIKVYESTQTRHS
jgi:glycosyltransferase involved in cell wall biosynthesis